VRAFVLTRKERWGLGVRSMWRGCGVKRKRDGPLVEEVAIGIDDVGL